MKHYVISENVWRGESMKGAIFDMDGLLLDTERIYQDGWRTLASEFVEEPNPVVPAACSGSAGDEIIQLLESYYPKVDAKRYLESVVEYYTRHVTEDLVMKPGVLELLEYFKSINFKMAVASSTFHSQIIKNLKTAGILSYFDIVISGLDVSNNKPAPDIFLEAARKLELAPEECYVFEDSVNGVKAGLCAGCKTIMIPDMQEPLESFYKSCTGIYSSLTEALEALTKKR